MLAALLCAALVAAPNPSTVPTAETASIAALPPGSVARPAPSIVATDIQYRNRWYGWQTLVADGVAVGAFYGIALAALVGGASTELLLVPPIAYVSVAPVIHLANRQPASAGISLLMRLIAPILIGTIVGQVDCAFAGRTCGLAEGRFAEGVLLGGVLATAADAIFLGRKKVPVDRRDDRRAYPPSPDQWQ